MWIISKNDQIAGGQPMIAMDKIKQVRSEFYKVLLELFAFYKEFVGKDSYGDPVFNIKLFCQISNRTPQFRQFY